MPYDDRNPAADKAALCSRFKRDIESTAVRLRRRNDDVREDMIQCAFRKLIEVAERYRYDSEKPVQFYSFAKFRVSGAMLDYLRLRSQRGLNRPKRSTYRIEGENTLVCLACQTKTPGGSESLLCGGCGAEHEPAEAAVKVILYSELMTEPYVAVDEYIRGRRGSEPTQEEGVQRQQLARQIEQAARAVNLAPRDALILRLRYVEELTLAQIGAQIGVLAPRVAQLHKAALELLKEGFRLCGTKQINELL